MSSHQPGCVFCFREGLLVKTNPAYYNNFLFLFLQFCLFVVVFLWGGGFVVFFAVHFFFYFWFCFLFVFVSLEIFNKLFFYYTEVRFIRVTCTFSKTVRKNWWAVCIHCTCHWLNTCSGTYVRMLTITWCKNGVYIVMCFIKLKNVRICMYICILYVTTKLKIIVSVT